MYLERAHLPFRSAACAGEINLADANNKPIANSAAETIFEVGALTTMTPAAVAAGISTLSKPTPARAITFKPFAAAIASASILVAERIKTASTPLPSAANNSARSAPLQLRTSKSGPSASNVAGLNSSAIKTTGLSKEPLATCCVTFFVIILVCRLYPRHHLAQISANLFNWMSLALCTK